MNKKNSRAIEKINDCEEMEKFLLKMRYIFS